MSNAADGAGFDTNAHLGLPQSRHLTRVQREIVPSLVWWIRAYRHERRRSGLESDESVSREEGDVLCLVGTFAGKASISQVQYPTDTETHIDALNVQCTLYPYDAESESRQIARVRRALEQVVRDVRAAGD